jgi:hypothetical protein
MTSHNRKFLLIIPVLVALAGLVWIQPKHVSAESKLGLSNLRGRYVSTELFPDTSQVSPLYSYIQGTTPLQWSSPLWDGQAEVMEADGKGNVFGEYDFTVGQPLPSTKRRFYHGQYTVDGDGRVVITTCPDMGSPTMIGTDNTVCSTDTTLQAGYLQGFDGTVLATVSTTPNGADSPNIRTRVWSKASVDIDGGNFLTKLRDRDDDDKDRDHDKDKGRH